MLRYLRKDYDNLLTVDVVCRAVPSPKLLRKYIEYHVGNTQSPLERVRFRDKYYGYQYSSFTFGHQNKTENYHRGVESNPYLRAFFSNTSVRPSCYACRFKKRYRMSDLTIWDCFSPDTYGVKALAHDFSLGVTKVLVYSERGTEAMDAIRKYAAIEEIVPETVIRGAREMTECVPQNTRRADFFRDLDNLPFGDVAQKYYPLTLRKRMERIIRVTLFKWGIYYRAKQVFKIFYKNKNNQKS